MPSFVTRVERPDRGGEWIAYLDERRDAAERWAARLGLDRARGEAPRARGAAAVGAGTEDELLAALLFESGVSSEEEARAAVRVLPPDERATLLRELVGARVEPPSPAGPRFEALSYRFEVVSDYGAFRDLQRHRTLTVQWQPLTPCWAPGSRRSWTTPASPTITDGLWRGRAGVRAARVIGRPEVAPYALCLGYRIRYVLDMNARAAMHLIELRSGREGHPSYRAVAHALHAEIARVHPAVAATMTHIDSDTEPRLERILSEIRTQAKAAQAQR